MQISILIVVDVAAALQEGTLHQNAYVIDNTQMFPTPFGPSDPYPTMVPGVANADGSQAAEAVLNWLIIGVSGLPTTLPRAYRNEIAAEGDAKVVAAVRTGRTPGTIAKTLSETEGTRNAPFIMRRDVDRDHRYHGVFTDSRGRLLDPHDEDAAASVTPILARIRGDAVDRGVMYPALYGSPDQQSEGLYWSASVDTARVGRHRFVLDVSLYAPQKSGDSVVWKENIFSMPAVLDVTQAIAVNGFNGGFYPPVLALGGAAPLQAGDSI